MAGGNSSTTEKPIFWKHYFYLFPGILWFYFFHIFFCCCKTFAFLRVERSSLPYSLGSGFGVTQSRVWLCGMHPHKYRDHWQITIKNGFALIIKFRMRILFASWRRWVRRKLFIKTVSSSSQGKQELKANGHLI